MRTHTPFMLLSVICASLLVTACQNADATPSADQAEQPAATTVEVLQVDRGTLHASLSTTTVLEAYQEADVTIRAPFDGVISRRYAKAGNFVQQHSRESLFHLVDLNRLQAVLHIPERDIGQVQIGQNVVFDVNEQQVLASVSRISPAADRVSGTFRVVTS